MTLFSRDALDILNKIELYRDNIDISNKTKLSRMHHDVTLLIGLKLD